MIFSTVLNPRFEITRNLSKPGEAMVFLDQYNPLSLTLALDKLLDPQGEYQDIEKVKLYFRQNDRPACGSYVFTGVIALEYNEPEFFNRLPESDLTLRFFAPAEVRRKIVARFAKKTGIPRQDVFISPSMTLVSDYYHNHRVRNDFATQAAKYFADGTVEPLARYDEQTFPKDKFAFPLYAIMLSVRLSVREEISLDAVRAFLADAKKNIFRSQTEALETTVDSALWASQMFDDTALCSCTFEANHVLSRDELPATFSRCIAKYREEEFEIDPETILNRIYGDY